MTHSYVWCDAFARVTHTGTTWRCSLMPATNIRMSHELVWMLHDLIYTHVYVWMDHELIHINTSRTHVYTHRDCMAVSLDAHHERTHKNELWTHTIASRAHTHTLTIIWMSRELIYINTSRTHVYTHGDCMAMVKSEYVSRVIYTNGSRTHMYQYVTNLCIHTRGPHGGVSSSDVRVSCLTYECITNSYTLKYINTSRTHVLI